MPSAAVCISCISIHALCEEGDLMVIRVPPRYSDFYPRPLRGGRQTSKNLTAEAYTFLSTPSARRATDFYYPVFANLGISIHALCEEGDARREIYIQYRTDFYPRPLRGGRPASVPQPPDCCKFLSTPSARRATSGPVLVSTS